MRTLQIVNTSTLKLMSAIVLMEAEVLYKIQIKQNFVT